jgi:bacillithiol system protein YtxJ
MKWEALTQMSQIDLIDKESESKNILIFKHSTRCSISDMALSRFERDGKSLDETIIKCYYLDLLEYRNISNALSIHYTIEHQSPQVLLISKGKCIFNESHSSISVSTILGLL